MVRLACGILYISTLCSRTKDTAAHSGPRDLGSRIAREVEGAGMVYGNGVVVEISFSMSTRD